MLLCLCWFSLYAKWNVIFSAIPYVYVISMISLSSPKGGAVGRPLGAEVIQNDNVGMCRTIGRSAWYSTVVIGFDGTSECLSGFTLGLILLSCSDLFLSIKLRIFPKPGNYIDRWCAIGLSTEGLLTETFFPALFVFLEVVTSDGSNCSGRYTDQRVEYPKIGIDVPYIRKSCENLRRKGTIESDNRPIHIG